MRIRRSVSRSFGLLVVPAISIAVITYFGGYGLFGQQGIVALVDTEARLGIAESELRHVEDEHARLAHRVTLMEQPGADSDLVEELARGMLMDGAPGQVALRRGMR
jgi:cell division protein FtsB